MTLGELMEKYRVVVEAHVSRKDEQGAALPVVNYHVSFDAAPGTATGRRRKHRIRLPFPHDPFPLEASIRELIRRDTR